MSILQALDISDSQTIIDVAENVAIDSHTEILIMLSAMVMPFFVLVAFSLVKYLTGVDAEKFDTYDFFAEMAIDLLSIFSSFIIGRYILETTSSSQLINSFKILATMAVSAMILCLIRRLAINKRKASNTNMCAVTWLVTAEYIIDVICLILMIIFL